MTAEPTCPAHSDAALYGPDFAADPGHVYEQLRRRGPVSRVELAPGVHAMLITDYETGLAVLRDEHTFTKDSRPWQQTMSADCPVLPIMGYRPNCNFASGTEHARLRGSITDSFANVTPSVLRASVERSADQLIDKFAPTGSADLLTDYARILPVLVLNQLFGCPTALSDRIVACMVKIFDAIDTHQANLDAAQCVAELVALKRAQPGNDITTWLMQHPAGLDDDEMAHQVIMMIGAGCEPQQNLIANALRLLLVDDRFAGDLSGGSMPVEDALDEVLWNDPPLANFCTLFPVRDVDIAGVRLRADEPILVSLAAANNDPALRANTDRKANRAHLAWGGGPHACPAQHMSRLIASAAIERLLDRLPDLTLAVPAEELTWRPGPFSRALTVLPVQFPPVHVDVKPAETPEESRWNARPAPIASTSLEPTSTPRTLASENTGRPRWLNSLVRWWRGQ